MTAPLAEDRLAGPMVRLSYSEPTTKKSSGDDTGLDAGLAPPSLSGLQVPNEHVATMARAGG